MTEQYRQLKKSYRMLKPVCASPAADSPAGSSKDGRFARSPRKPNPYCRRTKSVADISEAVAKGYEDKMITLNVEICELKTNVEKYKRLYTKYKKLSKSPHLPCSPEHPPIDPVPPSNKTTRERRIAAYPLHTPKSRAPKSKPSRQRAFSAPKVSTVTPTKRRSIIKGTPLTPVFKSLTQRLRYEKKQSIERERLLEGELQELQIRLQKLEGVTAQRPKPQRKLPLSSGDVCTLTRTLSPGSMLPYPSRCIGTHSRSVHCRPVRSSTDFSQGVPELSCLPMFE